MSVAVKTSESNSMTAKEVISAIRTCLVNGISEIERAGKLYAQAITKDPSMKEAIQEALPEVSPSFWARFERVGRGHAIAQLVYDTSSPAKSLIKCPLSDQQNYYTEPLPYLSEDGSVLKVSLHYLGKDQVKQVFAPDHVRGIPEQKAWLEQEKKDKAKRVRDFSPDAPSYEIVKKKVRFLKDTEWDRKSLAQILAKL